MGKSRCGVAAGFVAVVMSVWGAGFAAAAEPNALVAGSPEQTIEVFNTAVLEAMAFEGRKNIVPRYEILHAAVSDAFDMQVLSRLTINRVFWRSWVPEQKSKYASTLQHYQSAVMADRFKANSDISFAIDKSEALPGGRKVVVRTRILRSGSDESDIGLDYMMLARDGEWRIIDVYLDSRISEAAMRRSEYSQILRDQGFDALIGALEKQTEKILGSKSQKGS